METVKFGKTGRTVSRIGFGGATAGLKDYLEVYDPLNQENIRGVVKAIERALELGVTYFDTAPAYGNGASETVFGLGLEGVDPKKIFLATKVTYGDRDHVFRSIEESLKRLKRDYVDLLQIHGDTYTDAMADQILGDDGMLSAMEELKRQGVVKNIGFTSEDNNLPLYRFIRSGRFDTMQICYNFIFQHPYEPSRPFGSILEADRSGMGVAAMRTATSGTFQKWIEMVNPSNKFDYTRALIQFVLSNPYVDVALIGMRTAEFVDKNVEICEDKAGRIDLDKLHERYV